MYNFMKVIDPFLFLLKFRDSLPASKSALGSGDYSQMQGYFNNFLNQYLGQTRGMPGMGDFSQLQEYINGVIRESLNQSLGYHPGQPVNQSLVQPSEVRNNNKTIDKEPRIFETHDFVIVRVEVPDHVNERGLKVRIGTNKVIIKWGPYEKEQVIQIPADIKDDGITATIRDHILEIKIPKEFNINPKQIDIRYS